jgi:hypothetical protein
MKQRNKEEKKDEIVRGRSTEGSERKGKKIKERGRERDNTIKRWVKKGRKKEEQK